ncbi:MAG TPA: Mth938-like domain-containing protein [Mariprofundaceae bacterium]|nr:Mth938-like domain-containing protein [Mariprofundaceae bacterium]
MLPGDISPRLPGGTLLFTGYDDHWLKVGEQRYTAGLCLHAGSVTSPWGPEQLAGLTIGHLEPLLDPQPEVLIIGTGRLTRFPSAEIMEWLAGRHVGFECMDSRAAARTYNILVGEGREVSAAMLLPDADD